MMVSSQEISKGSLVKNWKKVFYQLIALQGICEELYQMVRFTNKGLYQ
jgi:hypothetical protein